MSQYKEAEIGDNVYFWFAANGTDGAAGDGATPLFDVRLAGAAADAAPTASGTPTLLSHANYGAGLHEILVDTDGYAAGEYAVFCTLTISTVNPGGFVGSFKLVAVGASVSSRVEVLRTAFILQDTTIVTAGRTTTQCALTAGAGDNDAYNGMYVILDNNAGSGGFTARKITDYVGASKTVVWSPAVTGTPEDGGRIIIVSGDAFNTLANIAYGCDTALIAENLDHLLKVTTGVAADADLEDYVVAGTVMAHVLSTSADVTTYKPSTDSLQSLRDNLATPTNITAGTITTATNVTTVSANGIAANSIAADAINAASLKADAVTKIIDDFETQSQADPTGFHVNVKEVNGTAQTAGDLATLLVDIPTVAEFEARTLVAAGYASPTNITAGVITTVTTVTTCTTNTDMRGTDSAALASAYTAGRAAYLDELAAANLPADLDTVKAVTEKLDSMIEVIP